MNINFDEIVNCVFGDINLIIIKYILVIYWKNIFFDSDFMLKIINFI